MTSLRFSELITEVKCFIVQAPELTWGDFSWQFHHHLQIFKRCCQFSQIFKYFVSLDFDSIIGNCFWLNINGICGHRFGSMAFLLLTSSLLSFCLQWAYWKHMVSLYISFRGNIILKIYKQNFEHLIVGMGTHSESVIRETERQSRRLRLRQGQKQRQKTDTLTNRQTERQTEQLTER